MISEFCVWQFLNVPTLPCPAVPPAPECLKDSMLAELEKRSPELGRNARYVTKSAISRLPHYLTVQARARPIIPEHFQIIALS